MQVINKYILNEATRRELNIIENLDIITSLKKIISILKNNEELNPNEEYENAKCL